MSAQPVDPVVDPLVGTVVVLAAGEGKRMRSATAKVLHGICGRPLLGHVLAATAPLAATRTLVVVGNGGEEVTAALADLAPDAEPMVQAEQLGTGHAVRTAMEAAYGGPGAPDLPPGDTVVVVPGDAPLLRAQTLAALVNTHREQQAAVTLLTAVLADPTGYGRVVRDRAGAVTAVVEERDADAATRAITEVGTSVYAFGAAALRTALAGLTTDNAQGEEYLTDAVAAIAGSGQPVAAYVAVDPVETLGVNDRVQLAEARSAMRDRLVRAAMLDGVTVTDPRTTWLGVRVRIDADATIHQNVQLHGATHIESGAVVGPNVTLRDTVVRAGARVRDSVCEGADIGADADVGPFTHLRPGTRLAAGSKAGAFVETKSATIGEGTKVPHLAYIGDATVGAGTNIGCGVVTVNYDGVDKHHTYVGDHAFIGSDTMLVAPVSVGDGAYTAAGSVITEDVPPGAIAVARGPQHNVDGWVERQRPGTSAAAAAARARAGAGTDAVAGENAETGEGADA